MKKKREKRKAHPFSGGKMDITKAIYHKTSAFFVPRQTDDKVLIVMM